MAIVDEDFKGPCFMCAEPGDAFWQGSETVCVYVCRHCAEEKLPLLIADAVIGPRRIITAKDLEAVFDRIKGSFWRGIALATSRKLTP
jgi:hypothetical protein